MLACVNMAVGFGACGHLGVAVTVKLYAGFDESELEEQRAGKPES